MGLELKNDINPTSGQDGLKCPIVGCEIQKSICLENTMVTAGFMDENMMREEFKEKQNWREICQKCRYYNF